MGWGLPLKKVWQTLWKRSWGNVSIPLLAVAARDVRVLSGLRSKKWWVSKLTHIRGSYYALWCLEVGDVWWKILIRVNKHLWYEWDDSIQGWCWFGTWDDANLNLQALDWTQKWCVLHLRHESKWLNVSQNPWIKFILHNNPSVLGSFQKLIFLASPGRRNFRRKTRICSFWSPRLGPETWLCRFLFPTKTACWLEFSTPREDRGGHVGWPWGCFPWTRGWDFMNEALRCEMVELFRNVDSKFVGAVAGELAGNCFDFFGHYEYETNNSI